MDLPKRYWELQEEINRLQHKKEIALKLQIISLSLLLLSYVVAIIYACC